MMKLSAALVLIVATLQVSCARIPHQKSRRFGPERMPELENVAVRASRARDVDFLNQLRWAAIPGASYEYSRAINPSEPDITKRRSTGVMAKITKAIPEARIGSSSYGVPDFPPGFLELRENGKCPHRGHLLAKELGGSGLDVRNIVTLTEMANIKSMRPWEDRVATAWTAGQIGDLCVVYYNVSLAYVSGQLHPKTVKMKADVFNPFSGAFREWFHVSFENDPVPPRTEFVGGAVNVFLQKIECTPTPNPSPRPRPPFPFPIDFPTISFGGSS